MMVEMVPVTHIRPQRSVTKGWLPRVALACLLGVAIASFWARTEAHAAPPEEVTKPTLTLSAPSAVTGTTAHFSGTVNPNAPGPAPQDPAFNTQWAFECTPACPGLGSGEVQADNSPHEVTADTTGLLPSTTYTVTLLAANQGGEEISAPQTFTTLAVAPTIAEESFSSVGSSTATLTAQIDPGGAPTSYRLQYVIDAQFKASGYAGAHEVPAPPAGAVGLPAASTAVTVQQKLSGLAPGTTYDVRFVATNTLGTAVGKGVTPSTASASEASASLPDGRAYEMVSPADGHDVFVPQTTNLSGGLGGPNHNLESSFPFRASADGNAVAYNGMAPATGGNGLELPSGTGNQFMAMRQPHGWTAADILPAPSGANETAQQESYQAFSGDLSLGVESSYEGVKAAPLVAGASACDSLYARTSSDAAFHALFTTTPTPALGECATGQTFAGASADSSHLLFESPEALTAQSEKAKGEGKENLYEAVGGQLSAVNVLNGKADPNATFGSQFPSVKPEERTVLSESDFSNVISADGSRVFWTDLNTNHVYVRENMTSTVPVSAGEAHFWTATPDGRFAFYTENEQLWRFDADTNTREALTPGGAQAKVQGVVGTSTDGAYVYFVAGGALAEGVTPRVCEIIAFQEEEVEVQFQSSLISEAEKNSKLAILHKEQEEEEEAKTPANTGCTLYVRHEQQTTAITTNSTALAPTDNSLRGADPNVTETEYGDWRPNLGGRTAEVTADGRNIVFESTHSLTSYDNNVTGGVKHAAIEAFAYNADSGRLSCVSCNPSGVAPNANINFETGEGLLPGSALRNTVATYMLRWLSDDGSRVFFDSAQSLVPQDRNGQVDVYEWEREGSPSCPVRAVARPNDGCLFMLSGGDGNTSHGSVFVDASASGDDVFFATRAKLVPGDRNENMKLYDARVGGGFPEPALACTGTGCQGIPPGPPQFATPPSATFNGIGNFPPPPPPLAPRKAIQCARGKKLSHNKCVTVKSKKRRSRSKKAKRVSNHRRAK
jgi:hypothetical protein